MSTRRLLRTVLAAMLLLCAGRPALSATTTADAADVQAQLHDWLANLFAPLIPADLQPITVLPDGDGFRLRVESPTMLDANVPHGSALTFKATRTADGMWALDDLTLPSPLVITLPTTPPPTVPGPSVQGPTPTAPTVLRLNTTQTIYRGLFDPTLTRPSHFETASEGTKSQSGVADASVGHSASSSDWTPTGDGRLNVISHSSAEAVHERFMQPNGTPAEWGWTHSDSTSRISGLSPSQLRSVIQTISQIAAQAQKAPQTPPGREQALAVFDSLFGVADSMTMEGDMSGLARRRQTVALAADDVHSSAAMASVDGRPHVQTRIALQGLDVASLAPGALHELMPRDITLAMGVGGVPKELLRQFLSASFDFPAGPAGQDARNQALARLTASGVDYAIDELAFNLGETALRGQGRMHWTGPNQITATADIEATDLDKLTARASTEPQLTQMLPILILARGMAKPDGDKLRWHIEMANNVLLVNGTDLRALMQPPQPRPGAGGPNASPARPRPVQPPPTRP